MGYNILLGQLSLDCMILLICGNKLRRVFIIGLFNNSKSEPILLKSKSFLFELEGLGGGVVPVLLSL